jgi:hypothetical protein
MRALLAIYNHARKTAPSLPAINPASLVDWNAEKRRDTGMGLEDLPAWFRQLEALPNPVRRAFHLFSPLSGSRPDAMSKVQWQHVSVRRRVLHIPSPKGGGKKACDIPLSRAMLRCLAFARLEGRKLHWRQAQTYVFPQIADQVTSSSTRNDGPCSRNGGTSSGRRINRGKQALESAH